MDFYCSCILENSNEGFKLGLGYYNFDIGLLRSYLIDHMLYPTGRKDLNCFMHFLNKPSCGSIMPLTYSYMKQIIRQIQMYARRKQRRQNLRLLRMQKSIFFSKNWKRKSRKNICLWMSLDKYLVNFEHELFQIIGFMLMVLII